ncbi:MAG: Clp protease N-terminal domain-containing protein [Dichotomicrobium sp.]
MSNRARAIQEVPHSPYFAHTVRRAFSIAAQRGSAVVGLDHFLFALLDDPDALALMEGCGTDIASIRVQVGGAIEKNTPRKQLGKSEKPQAGKALRHVLHVADQGAREAGQREVDGAIAIATLVGQSNSSVALLLNRHGLSFGKALGWIDSQAARGQSAGDASPDREQKQPAALPAPRQAPQPQRPAPRKREAPPPEKPRGQPKREPTLEEMLSTIRDVIDEDGASDTQTRKPPPPARKPPAGRSQPSGPAPAAPDARQRQQPKSNGAAGPHQQPRAAKSRSDDTRASTPVMGKLVERIPRVMRSGEREHVEVRIARETTEELIASVQGRGATHVHGVAVTRAMSLYLRAPDGGFMIEPLAPETQWVFDRPSFLDSEPFGCWQWAVLPVKRGSRRLQLVAAARSIDENGMIGDVALPEQVIEVRVSINWARSLRKAALWAGLAVAGGVLTEVAIRYLPQLQALAG